METTPAQKRFFRKKYYMENSSSGKWKLSPSAISLMEECPRCFWLLYNRGIKRPEGIFPSLPSGMDRILKNHFDKFMRKGELPPELKKDKELENCNLFDDEEKLKIWRNNLKGISFQDSSGNVLHGAVDNILVSKDNKLIVLDYKTRGFPLKEDTHEHYVNQLDIYAYLLAMNGYKVENYAYLLFYVPREVLETGEIVFDTTLKKLPINLKNAEQLWKKALDILRGEIPKIKNHDELKEAEEICEWCRLLSED
jgi:hypothetical protein